MSKPRKPPAPRNPMARALVGRLFAARAVPPRKGRAAQPKRQTRRVTQEG